MLFDKRNIGLWGPVPTGCLGILPQRWDRPFVLGVENGSPLFIEEEKLCWAQWRSLSTLASLRRRPRCEWPIWKRPSEFTSSFANIQAHCENQRVRFRMKMILSLPWLTPPALIRPQICSYFTLLINHWCASSPHPRHSLSRIHSEVSNVRKSKANGAISKLHQTRSRILKQVSTG